MRTNKSDYLFHADMLAQRERISRPATAKPRAKRDAKSKPRHLAARAARALRDIFEGGI